MLQKTGGLFCAQFGGRNLLLLKKDIFFFVKKKIKQTKGNQQNMRT